MTVNEKKTRNSKDRKAIDFDLLVVTESLGYKTYRKNRRNSWSREEDTKLKQLINSAFIELGFPGGIADISSIQESERVCKNISWEHIANLFNDPTRKPKDLRKRWTASLDPNLKKGKWTPEEDRQLLKAYEKHGSHWQSVSENIAGRTEDQCAKRYIEVLGPSTEGRLRKWTLEEDLSLVNKVKKYGTKWRRISSEMEFRPSLTCRNRWRKIITSVVRNKASPEITEAVKGDQDVPLLDKKPKTAEEAQIEPDSEDEEQEGGSSYEDSGRDGRSLDVMHREENGVNKGKNQNYDSSGSVASFAPESEVREPIILNEGRFKEIPNTSTARETSPQKVFDGGQPQTDKTGTFPNVLESLPALSKVCSQNETSAKSDSIEEKAKSNEDRARTELGKGATRHHKHRSHMEWKFILKDGEELSVSSGVISNSELVKELIEQAKKHSLKISIHQHIHNHYNAPQDFNGEHQRAPSIVPEGYSNFHTNSSSPSSGDSSKDFLYGSNGPVKSSCPDGYHDFLSASPNYNVFGLEPFTQLDSSTSGLYNQRPSQYVPPSYAPYGVRPDVPNSTRSTDELQDISRNRVSHFNYLPPTLKPQLESSNSTKASDLNILLNPSPTNGIGKKSKKRKRRHASGKSGGNTPGSSYQGSSQTSPTGSNSKIINPTDYPKSASSFNDDEGLDFWENLRSLADQPISSQKEERQSSNPFTDENRDLIYGLFNTNNHGMDAEALKKTGARTPFPLDDDTFIPFNPS
ncbi:uncharacterized protein ZBAI_02975 [Zygosaccharomyces bailii ISA1307]|nr:uncharacterized protein ZBAI_02975 [Zygosaccharomyces bailii ISA1307]